MIDKFKTCKDCPDRCAVPNCHMTCEGYLYRTAENEKLREERQKKGQVQQALNEYEYERRSRIAKICKSNRRFMRHR